MPLLFFVFFLIFILLIFLIFILLIFSICIKKKHVFMDFFATMGKLEKILTYYLYLANLGMKHGGEHVQNH